MTLRSFFYMLDEKAMKDDYEG